MLELSGVTKRFLGITAVDGVSFTAREILTAYHVPETRLKPVALDTPGAIALMKQGKLAISIGSNWYPTVWASPQSAAPWAAAKTAVGSAPFPTENGQGPGAASTLGGWAYAVSKASKNIQGAEDFIALASTPANQLTTAVWSGFVPPSTPVGEQPLFINFAPPFQADFNSYAKYGAALPNNVNFPVYARADRKSVV